MSASGDVPRDGLREGWLVILWALSVCAERSSWDRGHGVQPDQAVWVGIGCTSYAPQSSEQLSSLAVRREAPPAVAVLRARGSGARCSG